MNDKTKLFCRLILAENIVKDKLGSRMVMTVDQLEPVVNLFDKTINRFSSECGPNSFLKIKTDSVKFLQYIPFTEPAKTLFDDDLNNSQLLYCYSSIFLLEDALDTGVGRKYVTDALISLHALEKKCNKKTHYGKMRDKASDFAIFVEKEMDSFDANSTKICTTM